MANVASTDLEPTESLYFAVNDGGLIASKLRARRLALLGQELAIEDSLPTSTESNETHPTHGIHLTPSIPSPKDGVNEPELGETKAPSIKLPTPNPPTNRPVQEDSSISTLDTVAPYAADRHSTNTIDVVGDFIADLSEKPKKDHSAKENTTAHIEQGDQNEQQIVFINGALSSKLHARRAATAVMPAEKVAPPTRKLH